MQIETGKKRDNQIGKAKGRTQRKGAQRPRGLEAEIAAVVNNNPQFDYQPDTFEAKHLLAEKLSLNYKYPIGEINHLIEWAMRQKLYDWIKVEIGTAMVLHTDEVLFIVQSARAKFPLAEESKIRHYCALVQGRNRELADG